MYLLLPFLAAIAFAFGAMVYKRAFQEGAGLPHLTVLNNAILGVVFLPLLAFEPGAIPWDDWPLPVCTALAFALGQLLNVVSLRTGDVSLATPLLGAKVIFVALAGWLCFGVRLGATQWAAAALATAGVVTMGLTDVRRPGHAGWTVLTALGSAACFALTDTMIQAWGPRFGALGFLALVFAAVGVLSPGLLPLLGTGSLRVPAAAWKWILLGTALSGLQAIVITGTIAVWQDAARVNVVYATRGLWSIALVWGIGHWMNNAERHTTGARRMGLRLAGAALLLLAVGLAVAAGGR